MGSPPGSSSPATRASIARVTSGSAGPPVGPESLKPLSQAGLWLAVIVMPAAARWWRTAWATVGVGTAATASRHRTPAWASVPAAAAAKSSDRNRVSYPTTAPCPASPVSRRWSATARVRRRTFANV